MLSNAAIVNTDQAQKPPRTYKYLTLMSMVYLACELASLVLSYKIVHFNLFYGAAASFIFPITFTMNDIITEVYGYNTTKRIIWSIFFCDYIFVFLLFFIVQIPSVNESQQLAYNQVFGNLWRSLSGELVGVFVGAFINSVIISKWKILVKGKYFWKRSIVSSAIGELIMLTISVPIALYGVLSLKEIFTLILYAYIYKVIFAIVISGPASAISNFLKNKENIDIYDLDVSYNPFRLSH